MEIVNEIFILIVNYHLIFFNDFVPDPDLRYNLGWSIISFTSLAIFTNIVVLFCNLLFMIKLIYKLFKLKLQMKKAKIYQNRSLKKLSDLDVTDKNSSSILESSLGLSPMANSF
jgi:hypothetical protein